MVTQGDSAWNLPGARWAAICGHSSPCLLTPGRGQFPSPQDPSLGLLLCPDMWGMERKKVHNRCLDGAPE